ncbi:MAG: 6-phosphogluconolactonase [Bacteroidales bacterium]|nr:6-phosphogluconolactonase [Bacteroidales bacterium]
MRKIHVFPEVKQLSVYLKELIKSKTDNVPDDKHLSVALSGGSTPKKVFNHISIGENEDLNWEKIRLFWVDERCVPPDDDDSNFKMTRNNLLVNVNIPAENVHRIHGENDPEGEAGRYSKILKENVEPVNGLPGFDIVVLGLGEDGHTASIFPGNESLFYSVKYYEAVTHPQTGQHRITMTGPLINNAEVVIFIVTGRSKAAIVSQILDVSNTTESPASLVKPVKGDLIWLLDVEAAGLLKDVLH